MQSTNRLDGVRHTQGSIFIGLVLLLTAPTASVAAANYAAWPNGPSPSNNPNFFPIGVWLQSPPNVAEYTNIGINMYIGFFGSLDQGSLSSMAASQMPLVPTQNSVGLTGAGNSIIRGWDQMDEPDDAQPNGSGGYNPCISPATVVAAYNAIKANNASRPVFLNFGRGVSDINWGGRGDCTGDTNYYVQASPGGDILSFDIYPVAYYGGELELIPQGVDNLKFWSGNQKILWHFVEGSSINGGTPPTGAQVEAEVWMSLIHGSQGFIYFVHQFSPTFREDGIFNYPALVSAASNINFQVEALAPVLNSANVSNAVQVSSSNMNVPVDFMVKQHGGATYIFAAAMRSNSTTATFNLVGVPGGTATVLGEGRQIAVTGGQFQDSFAGYGVHLYQIAVTTTNPPAAAPSLLQPVFTNNQFRFTLAGTAGSNYVVQAVTNLAASNWISIATNPASWLFIESNANLYRQRFYRGVSAP
jgi:hypothetical protein